MHDVRIVLDTTQTHTFCSLSSHTFSSLKYTRSNPLIIVNSCIVYMEWFKRFSLLWKFQSIDSSLSRAKMDRDIAHELTRALCFGKKNLSFIFFTIFPEYWFSVPAADSLAEAPVIDCSCMCGTLATSTNRAALGLTCSVLSSSHWRPKHWIGWELPSWERRGKGWWRCAEFVPFSHRLLLSY